MELSFRTFSKWYDVSIQTYCSRCVINKFSLVFYQGCNWQLIVVLPENVGIDRIVTCHADNFTADDLQHAHPLVPRKEAIFYFSSSLHQGHLKVTAIFDNSLLPIPNSVDDGSKKRLNLISFGSGIDVIAIFFLEKSQIVYRTTLTRPRHYSCLSHKWKQMPTRRREHSRPLILDQTLRQGKKWMIPFISRNTVLDWRSWPLEKHIHNQAKELKQLTSKGRKTQTKTDYL